MSGGPIGLHANFRQCFNEARAKGFTEEQIQAALNRLGDELERRRITPLDTEFPVRTMPFTLGGRNLDGSAVVCLMTFSFGVYQTSDNLC